MAGGWEQAARLPAIQALKWLDEHCRKATWDAYQRSVDRYFMGHMKEAPEPPED